MSVFVSYVVVFLMGVVIGVIGMALVARHNLKRLLATLSRLQSIQYQPPK
jgi:ribose/xylose/arabinose/galactoside ABC-type transport system permease subunit